MSLLERTSVARSGQRDSSVVGETTTTLRSALLRLLASQQSVVPVAFCRQAATHSFGTPRLSDSSSLPQEGSRRSTGTAVGRTRTCHVLLERTVPDPGA